MRNNPSVCKLDLLFPEVQLSDVSYLASFFGWEPTSLPHSSTCIPVFDQKLIQLQLLWVHLWFQCLLLQAVLGLASSESLVKTLWGLSLSAFVQHKKLPGPRTMYSMTQIASITTIYNYNNKLLSLFNHFIYHHNCLQFLSNLKSSKRWEFLQQIHAYLVE